MQAITRNRNTKRFIARNLGFTIIDTQMLTLGAVMPVRKGYTFPLATPLIEVPTPERRSLGRVWESRPERRSLSKLRGRKAAKEPLSNPHVIIQPARLFAPGQRYHRV